MAILVFDSSPLSVFARAGRLSDLDRLTEGHRRVVPSEVLVEVKRAVCNYPELQAVANLHWLEEVRIDTAPQLEVFAECLRRLGQNGRNLGEAAAIAWAAENQSIVFLDDQAAIQYAKARGLEIRRTLAIIAGAVRTQRLPLNQAVSLVDELVTRGDAYFPCSGATFELWCRRNKLI